MQDVGEDQAPARAQHAGALAHEARLVGDVGEGLLRDRQREAARGKRHVQRVALDEAHAVGQTGQFGQLGRALHPAARQVQPGDAAAALPGQVARRPAHAAADVEHLVAGADAGLGHQAVHRRGAAVVVLVVVLQRLLGDGGAVDAARGHRGQDLLGADGVEVVEVDDGLQTGIGVHGGGFEDKG